MSGLLDLPALPGAYLLELFLPEQVEITVGRLGRVCFPAGALFYQGSARGSGGLRGRLGRHLQPGRAIHPHWHLDYVLGLAQKRTVAYVVQLGAAPAVSLECRWSQALAQIPGSCVPLAGFGASDCRAGCPAHLVAFTALEKDNHPLLDRSGWLQLLAQAAGSPLTIARLPG